MKEKNKLLTIGQFAALHGINKKTLMWYDEIGLFGPAVVHPENGYRYYSYRQSALLETILLLRELDVSVNEIQEFMKNRSAQTLKDLLEENIAGLDHKINHLAAVRKTLCNYRQNMETLLAADLSEITLITKEDCCLVTVEIDKEFSYDDQVERVLAETQKYHLRRLHDASYGTMISVENLYQKNYDDYSALFIQIPFSVQKKGLHIQPRGTYIKAFYKGDWTKMSTKYEEIFDYVQKHNLELTGFSYEMIINGNVTDQPEASVIQIEIPVRCKA